MTDDELLRQFESLREENAAIRQENAAKHDETRRHFDVVAERLENRIDAVAESLAVFDEKFERRVDEVEQRMERGFADTQAMIKFSHAELDRRVRALEQSVGDLQVRVERLEATTH